MKQYNLVATAFAALILSVPTLHTAASSSSYGPLVASSSTDSPAPQKANTVFALIGNDAKIADGETPVTFRIDSTKVAFINTEVASKYSSLLDHMAHTVLPALASQSTTLDITEQHIDVEAPGKLLLALTTIMHRAHEQEQYEKIVSAFQLSKNPSIISQMDGIDLESSRTLFGLVRMYEIKPIITDVIAIFTLRHFYKKCTRLKQWSTDAATFFALKQSACLKLMKFISSFNNPVEASFCERALAKQLYLSVPLERKIRFKWRYPDRRFTVSIQDLFDFNTLGQASREAHTFMSFRWLQVGDLAGIQHISNRASIYFLILSDNKLTTIPADAFSDFINLRELDLNDNRITNIASDAFTKLTNLRKLDLRNNLIDSADRARIEAEVKAITPNVDIFW